MPLLQNADRAIIDERKIRDYLLNPWHARGAHKARMFAAALGYQRFDHARLISQIRRGILACEAVPIDRVPHGQRFRVEILIEKAPRDPRSCEPSGSSGRVKMSQGSPRPIRSSERRGQPSDRPPRFELLQVVYVLDAHPGLGLVKGECGTIVETLAKPYPAYLVEFIDDDGSTKAEAAFTPDQLSATPPPP